MAADIYTTAFSDPIKWAAVCELVCVIDPGAIKDVIRRHRDRVSGASSAAQPVEDEVAPAAPCSPRGAASAPQGAGVVADQRPAERDFVAPVHPSGPPVLPGFVAEIAPDLQSDMLNIVCQI